MFGGAFGSQRHRMRLAFRHAEYRRKRTLAARCPEQPQQPQQTGQATRVTEVTVPQGTRSGTKATATSKVSGNDADQDTQTPPSGAEGVDSVAPAFPAPAQKRLRARWREVQGDFVDDPSAAVRTADALVAEVMGDLIEHLHQQRSALARQWTTEHAGTSEPDHRADSAALAADVDSAHHPSGGDDDATASASAPSPDTEALRLILRGYRALLEKLLDSGSR
ncbi:hypothetical protein RIF23_01100 [Lipingzhangella sp. LS1_29]|uniref:Uncharacterized protein n=1 Tax=Lipingzhangella rawalii TaxID=2055835 RepID=A0ABU2H0Q4_9ACTN|nr:hypothetical protein [Lipingzhangella rawalii]MDS1268885.1 hypothetical protein [Lipingzhangella rawalii]